MSAHLRHAVLALASISAVAAAGSTLAAGRVFYDGFESGNTNLWSQDDYHNRCQVVSVAADGVAGPLAGTRMVRCNHDGTVAWNTPARFETLVADVPYDNEFLLRVRLRIDRNLEKTGLSPTKVMRIYRSADLDMIGSLVPGDSISHQGVAGGRQLTTYWGGLDSASNPSSWHKVEWYINQSAGTIKVWHDGVLVRNNTGFNFGGVKWTPFNLQSNWEDAHDAVNYVYFDEVEIFSDTGTGASGSMSDATISATGTSGAGPANLRVTGTAP